MSQKYGDMANSAGHSIKPCLVCDNAEPRFSWTDLNGEGYCTTCGTPYQLVNGKLKEGESYPRINVFEKFIPLLRDYYQHTGSTNGQGTFLIEDDYPDQLEGKRSFNAWVDSNHEKYKSLFGAEGERGE